MAGSRTLKLSILGDVDNLNKSLKSASQDVDTFGDKMGKAGKMIGAAFVAAAAAAAAYAVKIGIDGVKAAVADEQAQTQLALALENATGATNSQIAATEQSILKMSLATGVADDQLRPALGRLVRSTGDITKAQDLLTTALDISTATGKPLETVANALGKAYDGNSAALGKLGIGLSAAELKTMSFTQVQSRLSDLFGGAAAANADTYAGRIARMQVAFDEAKETIGFALLPILEKLMTFINDNALPAINAFSNAFSLTEGEGFGKVISDVGSTIKKTVQPIFEGMKAIFDNVKTAVMNSKDEFSAFWDVVKFVAPLIGTAIGGAMKIVGDIAEVVITIIARVLAAIKPLLNTAIDGINLIIKGYNAVQWGKDVPTIPKIGGGSSFATGGAPGAISGGGSSTFSSGGSGTASGGSGGMTGGGVAAAARAGSSVAAAIAGGGFTDSQNAARLAAAGGGGFTDSQNAARISITVNGAIDKEGTARTIVETLNNSYYRGTGGATALVAI
jgi:hypothetical protein